MAVTTKRLVIFATVERLAPKYDGNAWFSVNLSAAFESEAGALFEVGEALVRAYLRPWTTEWSRLRVLGIKDDAVVMNELADVIRPSTLASWSAALDKEISAELSQTSRDIERFTWVRDPKNASAAQQSAMSASQRNWRAYLAHLSTYPADLGHRANTAAFFKLPAAFDFDEIVVAPLFGVLARDTTTILDQRDPMSPVDATCLTFPAANACPVHRLHGDFTPWSKGKPLDDVLYSWNYEPAKDKVDVMVVQGRALAKVAAVKPEDRFEDGDGIVDVRDLWISPTAISQGDDWQEGIEARVAQALDLPGLLLDAARSVKGTVLPDELFATAFVAALHDTAGVGILAGPDGDAIVKDAIRHLKRALNLNGADALEPALRAYPATVTLEVWRADLEALLKARRKPSVPERPAKAEDVQEYLDRLDSIRLLLADTDALADVMVAGWKRAVEAAASTTRVSWQTIASEVSTFLRSLNLRDRQLLGSGGAGWRLMADFSDTEAASKNLALALEAYYKNRCGTPADPKSEYAGRTPAAAQLAGEMHQAIIGTIANAKRLKRGAEAILGAKVRPPAIPTLGLEGIAINMAKPRRTTDPVTFDARLRGACLMLRHKKDKAPWSILNLAQYSLDGEAVADELNGPPYDAERVFPVPRQFMYRNGLRQVNCVYKNHPPSAKSPAALFSRKRRMKEGLPGTKEVAASTLMTYWNPYGSNPKERPLLPRLVFGEDYDVAGFVVGLAGNLPNELADPAEPWSLKDVHAPSAPPDDVVKKALPYRRTQTVSTIRFQATAKRTKTDADNERAMDDAWIPSIPSDVYPLARRLQPIPTMQEKEELINDEDRLPLILLPSGEDTLWTEVALAHRTVSFFMRPPAIHWPTWDAWSDPRFTKDTRAQVLAEYHVLTDLPDNERKEGRADMTLDDPAVGSARLVLEQKFGNTSAKLEQTVTFKPDPAGSGVTPAQALAREVTVTAGGAAKLEPSGDKIVVEIPPGEVWQLTITPQPVTDAQKKFSEGLWPATETTPPESLFTPTRLLIEVAQPLPVADTKLITDLHTSLVAAHTFQPAGDASKPAVDDIAVHLKPAGSMAAHAPYLHRADVLVQRQRWQGRPLFRKDGNSIKTDFPFEAIEKDPKVLQTLDGVLFGDRRADDYLITGARTDFGDDKALTASGMRVYAHDTSTTPQAMYFRFSIRVFSRYEGWLNKRASLDSRFASATAGVAELWQRLVVKCRQTAAPLPPAVKLIVPLTRTRGDGDETPGWEVVLEEPWEQYAGLAETFEASVETAINYSKDEKGVIAPKQFLEAGPDPIDTLTAAAVLDQIETVTPAPLGPIGYTFDTDTDAPLFVRASFFLPAPTVKDVAPKDLGNYFFKLKFRRTVSNAGMAPTLLPKPLLERGRASAFTEPQQAQLLPASTFWDTKNGRRLHVNELRYDGRRRQLFHFKDPNTPVVIVGSSTNKSSLNLLEPMLLLKNPVTDAFGSSDQEVMVGTSLFKIGDATAPEATYAHLVEIQTAKNAKPLEPKPPKEPGKPADPPTLAEELFPGSGENNERDARRRIVRVSPRIEPL